MWACSTLASEFLAPSPQGKLNSQGHDIGGVSVLERGPLCGPTLVARILTNSATHARAKGARPTLAGTAETGLHCG